MGSLIRPKESLENRNYSKYVLRLQKERQKYKKKFILLFLRKAGVGAIKVITNSFKKMYKSTFLDKF